MSCRWKMAKTTITGTTAMVEAAKTSPQSVRCCPWNREIAIGSVRLFGSLMMVSAQTYSSQLARNEKMLTVARAGRDSGRMSCR